MKSSEKSMKYDVLFKKITRLTAEMVAAGGSSATIPLVMNYICDEYGLKESEFIINANGVHATAIAPDGTDLTALRSIDEIGQNFGKLHRLDQYCETIRETLPSAEEIDREIEKINSVKYISTAKEYIASIFLGTGFAALFGCSLTDMIIAAAACALIVLISSFIRKYYTNLFFTHTVVCLVVETFILLATKYFGICKHPESVSMGVIMLLISGLSFSEGLWSMLNKETAIGIYRLNNALIGAIGIVMGVAIPLSLIGEVNIGSFSITAPIWLQVVECILACGGFTALCCVEAKYIPVISLGAGLSWLVYALVSKVIPSLFLSMALATAVVTLYSLIAGWKKELNPNIIRVVGILPLVPGTNLFYMLYGAVTQNMGMVGSEAKKLITACLGISFGMTIGLLFLNLKGLKLKVNASK